MLAKSVAGFGLVTTFLTTSSLAQELPQKEKSFEVEPPLLPQPAPDSEEPATVETLKKRLENSKESAASAARLVKKGVLAQLEAEQQTLRVLRLEAELADAQLAIAQEQVAAQKKRREAGEIDQGEQDAAVVALAPINAAAQSAQAKYEKAQLDAAALALRRQRQLFAQGSSRKADVARAEEKLAALQQSASSPAQPTPSH
jgi:hypothetical protein